MSTSALVALSDAAATHGAPFIQLTSRGNLQVRALPDPLPAAFVDTVTAAGFLPHPTHERVRNIVASPWSAHAADLAALVSELDAGLCADPTLARLPGRMLFVLDDGSGHLLGLPFDLGYQRVSDVEGRLLAAGGGTVPVSRDQAVGAVLERARHFVRERETLDPAPWNVRELPAESQVLAGLSFGSVSSVAPPPAGRYGADVVATVPLGLLTPPMVAALAAVADRVAVTPWRRLVIAGSREESLDRGAVLAAAGLVVEPASGWDQVTACIGAPHCRRTSVRTLELARGLVAAGGLGADELVHVSGCERRCGKPAAAHRDVLG